MISRVRRAVSVRREKLVKPNESADEVASAEDQNTEQEMEWSAAVVLVMVGVQPVDRSCRGRVAESRAYLPEINMSVEQAVSDLADCPEAATGAGAHNRKGRHCQ